MNAILRRLAVLPALGLALGAIVLAEGAIDGSQDVPLRARSLTNPPRGSDIVAPAPEGLSSVTVTRDWQEVATSGSKRPPR